MQARSHRSRGGPDNLNLAPQAAGLLAASLGFSRMYRDDLAQLEAALTLYDAFYRWCRDATEETHNWPRAKKPREIQQQHAADTVSCWNRSTADLRGSAARVGAHRAAVVRRAAGQIALMHRELVEERKWIDEGRYLNALNFCMLLPGPRPCSSPPTSAGGCMGLRAG